MAEKDLLENPFRDEIYDYLLAHGYVAGQRADYDYKNALDVGKLFALHEGGWMPEEIARDLGCSVAAVKYHLDKKKKGARK